MKTPENSELLNDVLGGDELSLLRDATLAQGLAAMRTRARRRRRWQAAAIIVPVLFLALRAHFHQTLPAPSEIPPAPPPVAAIGKVKYITKDELFALFPNRPVALIGEPGHQQFVLLDELRTNPLQ
jgi:hypothetical protein